MDVADDYFLNSPVLLFRYEFLNFKMNGKHNFLTLKKVLIIYHYFISSVHLFKVFLHIANILLTFYKHLTNHQHKG